MTNVKIDELSDTELLDLSRRGDNSAFGVLWERHRRAGIVAARNIASTLDPEDLVSGAYLKIFELVQDGRGPKGAFRPYLYKVISSIAADTYRSPEHSNVDLTEVPNLTEAGPWEDGAFDLNAAARAFESLPGRWQAALWYSEVEGLAPREIAPILGISANSVSALSARAKEGLQSAWVETHIDMQRADEACETTRSRLQRYQLGKLTSRRSREVAAHLETCDSCAAAATEFSILNKQLALVLATIFLGGVPAAALMKSLGAGAATAGVGAGTIAASVGGGSTPVAGGSSTGNSAAGAAAAGTGAGIGVGVIALVATATLAVAAVGGLLIANTLGDNSADLPMAETTSVESETESETGPDSEKGRKDEAATLSLTETNEAAEKSFTTRGSGPSTDRDERPTRPRPPRPILPPPVVPPNPPVSMIAGYQCYVPHVDTGEFELIGRASLPKTVEIGINSSGGTAVLQVNAAADRTWTSGALSGLDAFLDGSTTAEVRLISGANSSVWEVATVAQCAGSGPTVDNSISLAPVCVADPGAITLYGELSEYGVLFARKVAHGSASPISDPALDGVIDPTNPWITWAGIFTGSDVPAPNGWWSPLSLDTYFGNAADYNSGLTGRLELRVQTPDYRTSTWIHVDQLIDSASCPF